MTLATDVFTPRYRKLLREFPLREIRTRKEADAATQILDVIFRDRYDDPGEEAYAYALGTLLADYEDRHDSFKSTATGLEVLRHVVEESGMKQAELGLLLGVGQSAVSQVLSGTKQITAEHARRLGKHFKLNPGTFL